MKRTILTLFIVCCGINFVRADVTTFTQTQGNGNTITYQIYDDAQEPYLLVKGAKGTGTLVIPESVEYEGVSYKVLGEDVPVLDHFYNEDITMLCLPKTFVRWNMNPMNFFNFFRTWQLQAYYIEEGNPRIKSIDGVIYSTDMDTLVAFPTRRTGRYDVADGTKVIWKCAFEVFELDTLNLPETVVEIEQYGIYYACNLRSFRYPNSISKVGYYGIVGGPLLETLILGSRVNHVSTMPYENLYPNLSSVYCLAPTPPITSRNYLTSNTDHTTLFVPRASINLYEAHPAWGLFTRITAIEPPIVSGINEAEVTWVSNADATGYSWELYLDEERTVLVMRLTFARDGRLLELEFGSGFMSSSSPAPMRAAAEDADGEGAENEETTERQFTTYYSFTVKNLSPNTQYYYSRKTYGEVGEDGEPVVIDEEQSDFTTLSDTSTSLSSATDSPAVQKVLRNGSVYILNGDETYTLTGAEVR